MFNKIPVLQKKFLQGIANTSPQTFDYTCTCISPYIHNSIIFEKKMSSMKKQILLSFQEEVIQLILSYLDIPSLCMASVTSK